jgi:hypothetical protein
MLEALSHSRAVETILAKSSAPYELMVLEAIYTGLPAELAGLRWNDLGDSTIDERYCGDCSQKRNDRLIVGSHAETAVLIGSVK